ncbi:MAG: alpha/beta hydrolase [Candidatus Korobacteraceae bacterium]
MTTVPWQGRHPSHKARLLAWILLLLAIAVIPLYPRARDYLQAASLLQRLSDPNATGWLANFDVHPVDVRDTTFNFQGKAVPAHVYTPRGIRFAPGIVMVHGMHRLGIDEPRLVSSARAVAASGFFVMTPLVPGIADYRVERESADLIGTAARSFAQEIHAPKVGILAISFSGGLSLLAASDPQYSQSIAWVASVGGYYDLAHVLRFFATGEAVRPDGSIEHMQPHEYGPLIVIYDEPQDFFAPQDVQTAHKALKLLLAEEGKASEAMTETMTRADQQIMQRIYHKQRASFAPEILAEINKHREELAAASPAGHFQALHVPVLLLHGSDDTIIPPTEMLWLQRDIPKKYLLGALISPAIGHVNFDGKERLRAHLALVHWMALMIHEARTASDDQGAMPLPAGLWLTSAAVAVQLTQPW